MKVWLALFVFAVVSTGAACSPAAADATPTPNRSPSDDEASAVDALYAFFDALAGGNYAGATELFGGSYEVLRGYNPTVAAYDFATLWRNGCSINGLNCLQAGKVTLVDRPAPGVYVFDVEFQTREGELFVLGPCCGATETEQPPLSVFPIRVAGGEDGRYRVLDLPPYTP